LRGIMTFGPERIEFCRGGCLTLEKKRENREGGGLKRIDLKLAIIWRRQGGRDGFLPEMNSLNPRKGEEETEEEGWAINACATALKTVRDGRNRKVLGFCFPRTKGGEARKGGGKEKSIFLNEPLSDTKTRGKGEGDTSLKKAYSSQKFRIRE